MILLRTDMILLRIITILSLVQYAYFLSHFKYTNQSKLRNRRGLIFQGGGVNKMIFGAIYPLYLADPIKWRQLNCGYNMQAQYSVPTSPLYPWDKWEGRSLKSVRVEFDKTGHYVADESRKVLYIALETFMNNRGKHGRKCLLRSICENAQIDDHKGIFSEILNIILTPGKDELEDEYRDAYDAGKSGIHCLTIYPECQKGDGFLDIISHIS